MSDPLNNPPRAVIREASFEDELHVLIPDARAADDFVEGAEFLIARDPTLGVEIEAGIWEMPMAPIGEQSVTILYVFNNITVWLLGLRPSD